MRGRSFSLNPLEEERGFHQLCVEPPLLQEDIPPNDESWLYPGCDFKVDCIDLVNDSQGTDLSVTDNWEKVYPKEAVVAALGEKLDDIYGLPSDDSEDDNYNPENPDLGESFEWTVKEHKQQQRFNHITSLVSSSIDEIARQRSLAFHIIEPTEVEVERLSALKTNKLRELIFKRQNELEEIYRSVHMDVDSETACQILIHLMESGSDLSGLLSSMDDQVVKAKEEAASRKDVPDKMEKWKHASQEKSWLDKYGKDENRYNTGKDVHINLKRTKKARILVSKIPSLVENLTAKMKAWEK
ncbi:65-kDa microtubule-associated protein 5 [Capsicum annuum]|nr:65-kDa microtubule-associated protein 5 [Capsicum annuum]